MLNVCSITKTFVTRPVLRGVDLDVPEGQAVCLCGINGAGKSTLLRVVAGLLRPDSGSVTINGHNIRSEPEKAKRQIGMISHASMAYPELTVLENLAFAARLYGVSDRMERIEELLTGAGLMSYRHDRAAILSRGLLQRLAIARALVRKPEIYIFDDTFSALDFKTDAKLRAALRKETGDSTVIIVAQRVNTVMDADRIIVVDDGRVAGMGTHRELIRTCEVYREIVSSQLSEEELA